MGVQGKHLAHFEVFNYLIMIGCFMHNREGAAKASILSLKVLEHADLTLLQPSYCCRQRP